MNSEIQLPLADGATCTVRRECLIIAKGSLAASPWNWLLILPVLFYGSMPGFILVLLAVIVIIMEASGVPVIAFLGRAEILVVVLLTLWIFGLLISWLRNRRRIHRDKVFDILFQGDVCILKPDSLALSLRFVDPKAAQEAFTSLGWTSIDAR